MSPEECEDIVALQAEIRRLKRMLKESDEWILECSRIIRQELELSKPTTKEHWAIDRLFNRIMLETK